MKKAIVLFMMLIVLLSFVSAASWNEKVQRAVVVQGIYDSFTSVKFERIATQTSSFSVGMPFDIEGRLVQYGQTEYGREIAYWSIISNKKFTFTIEAEKLTSEGTYNDGTSKSHAELDYIMTFSYDFGYSESKGTVEASTSGKFSLNTETGICEYTDPNDDGQKVDCSDTEEPKFSSRGFSTHSTTFSYDIIPIDASDDFVIGSVNGSVYFQFTENTSKQTIAKGIELSNGDIVQIPSGNYYADIKMTVTTNT